MRKKTDPFTIGGIGHHTPCLPENGEGVMRSLQHKSPESVTNNTRCNTFDEIKSDHMEHKNHFIFLAGEKKIPEIGS